MVFSKYRRGKKIDDNSLRLFRAKSIADKANEILEIKTKDKGPVVVYSLEQHGKDWIIKRGRVNTETLENLRLPIKLDDTFIGIWSKGGYECLFLYDLTSAKKGNYLTYMPPGEQWERFEREFNNTYDKTTLE